MQSRIIGSILPVLQVSLDPGERLVSETGELSWKSPNVSLRTSMAGGGAQGFLGAVKRSIGAGIFGGDGFRLQRVAGRGRFWVELGGEVLRQGLAPGEAIDVHPGHVGMFEDSVDFGIIVLPGPCPKLFAGDGFFLARLTGPGRIWLQTLTLPNLAHALSPYLPKGG